MREIVRAPLHGETMSSCPSVLGVLFEALHSERIRQLLRKRDHPRALRLPGKLRVSRCRFVNPTGGVGLLSFVKREGQREVERKHCGVEHAWELLRGCPKIHSAYSFAPQAGLGCHWGERYPTLAPPGTERGTELLVGLQSDVPPGLFRLHFTRACGFIHTAAPRSDRSG